MEDNINLLVRIETNICVPFNVTNMYLSFSYWVELHIWQSSKLN
jgi:hypothetical protein